MRTLKSEILNLKKFGCVKCILAPLYTPLTLVIVEVVELSDLMMTYRGELIIPPYI